MPERITMTSCVAPNGINTIVVPRERLVPLPESVGGLEHLPDDNPSVTIELPDEPEGRVSIGIDGCEVPSDRFLVQQRVVYFAVPPLAGDIGHGRVSYVFEGAMKLLGFQLARVRTVDELMDSLQAQFDNMTELVAVSTASSDPEACELVHERARFDQRRLVDAMELMPWSPQDYDRFHTRACELEYTKKA